MNYELRDSFIKKIKPHPAEVEPPPSVREVADRRSDGRSQSALLTITFSLIYEWVAAP